MDVPRSALPPGVLSLHVLPAEHHDRDWDAIIVPREVKERLFAPFQRGVSSRHYGGLGLGLFITRVIVERARFMEKAAGD